MLTAVKYIAAVKFRMTVIFNFKYLNRSYLLIKITSALSCSLSVLSSAMVTPTAQGALLTAVG
jgi:hypothetical protein